ncbi:MAG: 4-(cytidine 5'-diphospho)-2-C-methyl-D-erythritol kinase [Planctomycetaceae bacterium]|jgi:4-diphosphocytidyl-2-C-methyl-D-erythritol kinase|nr:4-(cytidine 5'-diphospho)-2-C-methyl-D-erythritol kinase [Planctomycetaceae bacterium]
MQMIREEFGWRVETPAKLNLFLEITGKRPDGFHDIETVMTTVGLFDTLVFREVTTESISLHCLAADDLPESPSVNVDDIPTDDSNLVMKAANLLKKHAGNRQGVEISLHKRIPAEAGLAGGSSDAAATFAALNQLWNLNLPQSELQDLAAELGSDIPFFLAESSWAVCRGRGEIIEPLPRMNPLWIVIVRPPVGLSTADVYRACRPADNPLSAIPLIDAIQGGRHEELEQHLHNSLQTPAEQLCPLLEQVRQTFEAESFLAHQMSGSGTAWFGICRTESEAQDIATRFKAQQLGHVFVVSTIP